MDRGFMCGPVFLTGDQPPRTPAAFNKPDLARLLGGNFRDSLLNNTSLWTPTIACDAAL